MCSQIAVRPLASSDDKKWQWLRSASLRPSSVGVLVLFFLPDLMGVRVGVLVAAVRV